MGDKSFDIKYVVLEHECVDVGCFEHRVKGFYDLSDMCKAEKLLNDLKSGKNVKTIHGKPIDDTDNYQRMKTWLNTEYGRVNQTPQKGISEWGEGYGEAMRMAGIHISEIFKRK